MRSLGGRMGPNPINWCSDKKRRKGICKEKECYMTTKAENEVTWPQAKEH